MRYYADHSDMKKEQEFYSIGGVAIPIIDYEDPNHAILEFFVPGPPRAKQSFRYGAHGHSYTPARIKAWQADVGWAAQQAIHKSCITTTEQFLKFPIKTDVSVDLIFLLPDNHRIDADNLSKAVLDALNGIAWEDDRQAIDLHPRKFVVSPDESGVYVIIHKTTLDLDLLADIQRKIQWQGLRKKESEA